MHTCARMVHQGRVQIGGWFPLYSRMCLSLCTQNVNARRAASVEALHTAQLAPDLQHPSFSLQVPCDLSQHPTLALGDTQQAHTPRGACCRGQTCLRR